MLSDMANKKKQKELQEQNEEEDRMDVMFQENP